MNVERTAINSPNTFAATLTSELTRTHYCLVKKYSDVLTHLSTENHNGLVSAVTGYGI